MRMFRMPEIPLRRWVCGVMGCLLMLHARQAAAADTNTASGWVTNEFEQAAAKFHAETNSADAAWQFARACFDMADLQKRSSQEAAYAEEGMAASRVAVELAPNSAPAHYYLGMNIAELASTKHSLSALRMVKDVEREFQAARLLDEKFDEAGADRNLGTLYRDAPAFVSVGSRAKARQHLERAVELAPGYPDNHITLIEGYLKWDYRNEALRQLHELEQILPDARKKFSGPAHALDWEDWDKRLNIIKRKLEGNSKVNESPHSQ
ncbi:MAG TPA: hypothetical protein VN873_17915 [Candidatus Angelobacter sp.]|nr:hypothetical protein [Candidatus Angelobacter sp.]